MRTHRLALRRETLTELSTDELTHAVGGVTLTLAAGCSADDVTQRVEDLTWRLSLHQHCSWSCI